MPGKRFVNLSVAIVVFLFSISISAWAVPQSITYQGKLTDSSGLAVPEGAYTVTFSIYDRSSGGDPIWSDEQNVMVKDGIFNVKLPGDPDTNPFPSDLLSNGKLYLGIKVGTDGEMTPRQEITATFYAMKAGDTEKLGGIPASQMASVSDLEEHASDPGAHHSKTTSFSELTDQITDGQIPASITRDAELNASLQSHASNSSAHHVRYSNIEAVGAMGKKGNTNPLNHDRYSDTEAVEAILASDGPGSGLDADLLDGQQADDIIAAATDEVRTAISDCGTTISTPGSYYLTGNLSCTGHGVVVASDGVTLDLMGFTISGDGGENDYGVYISNVSNVEVKNGTIKGFGKGVYATYQGNSIRAILLRVTDNGYGMHLVSKGNLVKQCSASGNQSYGIFAGSGSAVINNTAYGNGGTGLFVGSGATIIGNTVYDNDSRGIDAGTGSSLTGNTAYSNNDIGIYVGTGSAIVQNSASYNKIGFEAGAGSALVDNASFKNDGWGILVNNLGNFEGEATVTNNSITYNNVSDTSSYGGLWVPSNCHVKGNSVSYNRAHNIYVYGSHNVIEENLVTHSTNGIYFRSTGNFWANNRASGNTNNFVNGGGQTSGGGNYGF